MTILLSGRSNDRGVGRNKFGRQLLGPFLSQGDRGGGTNDGSGGHPDLPGGGGDKRPGGKSLFIDVGKSSFGGLKFGHRGHNLLHRLALATWSVHVQNQSGGLGRQGILHSTSNDVD